MTSIQHDLPVASLRSEKAALLNSVAKSIRERRMEVPAVLCLETLNPVSNLLHSAALVSMPLLSAIVGHELGKKLVALLESRDDIELLIQLIEKPVASQESE